MARRVVHDGIGEHQHDIALKPLGRPDRARLDILLERAQVHGPPHHAAVAGRDLVAHRLHKHGGMLVAHDVVQHHQDRLPPRSVRLLVLELQRWVIATERKNSINKYIANCGVRGCIGCMSICTITIKKTKYFLAWPKLSLFITTTEINNNN